jgi:hypothetical protein
MKRKTLLLHIGMGKTGTTVLQEFFWENRDALAMRGICYPEIGSQSAAHHLISPHHPPFLLGIGWRFLTPRDWIDAVQAMPQNRILMSSELMFSGDHDRIGPFLDEISKVFDVKIIIYLRRPDNAIMAAYNQQVKAGNQIRGIEAMVKKQLPRFDYLDVIKRWENANTRMIVRPYEHSQLKDGDVIADFLAHVLEIDSLAGFKIPIAGSNANPRFATMALDFKVMINNLISDMEASAKFNAPLIEYSQARDVDAQAVFRDQDTLSAAQRTAIIEYFR